MLENNSDGAIVVKGVDVGADRIEIEVNTDNDNEEYKQGDFVSRCGDDIHYVVEFDGDHGGNALFVCVVPDDRDVYIRGETESNLYRRYSRINRHFLNFAKSELQLLRAKFPKGFEDGEFTFNEGTLKWEK